MFSDLYLLYCTVGKVPAEPGLLALLEANINAKVQVQISMIMSDMGHRYCSR